MIRLRWARPAVAHLREIGEHIQRDNPRAASRVVQNIREQVAILARHPEIGRPGRIEGTRELVIPRLPYVVVYRLRGDIVEVVAVVHTSRRWPEQPA
jgi:toxin ParE1/3/4